MALRKLGVPESVVKFLASLDEENEVHIITSCGVTYDTPDMEKNSNHSAEWSKEHPKRPSCGWL